MTSTHPAYAERRVTSPEPAPQTARSAGWPG